VLFRSARIGVHTTGGVKGLIRDFRLTDTVIGLQRSRVTGILTVENAGARKRVFINNGDMVFAASDLSSDTIGEMLLRKGRLTPGQLALVRREMESSGQKEGAVLVRMGHLKPRDLVIAVRQLVEEIILGLFGMGEGRFRFEAMPLPPHEVISLKLSAANLIFNGIKKVEDLRYIERDMPPLSAAIAVSEDPIDLYQDLKLDYAATRIISCIGGGSTIGEVIRSSGIEEAEAVRTIYALLSVKVVAVSDEGYEGEEPSLGEIIGEEEGVEPGARPELDPALKAEIEQMHARCYDIGYYGVLGVKDDSGLAQIKTAYYRAAKKFHPDIHFTLADDALKDMLSDIFSYIYEAYSTLSDPARRKEYDDLIRIKPARLSSSVEKAREKFREGRGLLKLGRFEEAELLLGQAVYFDHSVAEYHYYYGLALVRQKKFKAGEKAVGRALRIEPFNPTFLTEQGFIFLELGFPSRARGLFEKALQAAPDNAPAMAGLKKVRAMEDPA